MIVCLFLQSPCYLPQFSLFRTSCPISTRCTMRLHLRAWSREVKWTRWSVNTSCAKACWILLRALWRWDWHQGHAPVIACDTVWIYPTLWHLLWLTSLPCIDIQRFRIIIDPKHTFIIYWDMSIVIPFVQDSGLEIEDQQIEPFLELHRILEALKQRNLSPALQ